MSLALAGVIYLVLSKGGTTFPGYLWLLGITLLSIVGIPFIRFLSETTLDRVSGVQRVVLYRRRLAISHLLFHIYSFMSEAEKLYNDVGKVGPDDKKGGAKRGKLTDRLGKITTQGYPWLLADAFHVNLGLNDAETLMSFFQCNPDVVGSSLQSYIENSRIDRKRDVEKLFDAFMASVSDISTISSGLEIATLPGTGRAVNGLTDKVDELVGSCRVDHAKSLVERVDKSRGTSMIELADLRSWYKSQDDMDLHPDIKIKREQALGNLRREFRKYLNANGLLADNTSELTVVTGGYSTAVRECLTEVRKALGIVYIVLAKGRSIGEDRQMRADLNSNGIERVSFIEPEHMQNLVSSNCLDMVLIGFEVVTSQGDIFHPRGVMQGLQAVTSASAGPKTIAVGESWKVRDFSMKEVDHAVVSIYPANNLDAIVTDCGSYLQKPLYLKPFYSKTFDLSSAAEHWRSLL